MTKEKLIENAFNLGMSVEKSDTGEIVIRTGMCYNSEGNPEPIVVPEPKKRAKLRLIKNVTTNN